MSKKPETTDPLILIRKVNRERQLAEGKMRGFPRSKQWGGKGNKGGEDRRRTKDELRRGDFN